MSASADGSATVLDEYVRLDKTICDCEHSLLVAERLKARGHTLPENEIDAVRLKLSEAMVERDFIDEWMRRREKSPNSVINDNLAKPDNANALDKTT